MRKFQKLLAFMLVMAFTATFTSCSDDDDKEDNRNPVQINKKSDTALLLCSFHRFRAKI